MSIILKSSSQWSHSIAPAAKSIGALALVLIGFGTIVLLLVMRTRRGDSSSPDDDISTLGQKAADEKPVAGPVFPKTCQFLVEKPAAKPSGVTCAKACATDADFQFQQRDFFNVDDALSDVYQNMQNEWGINPDMNYQSASGTGYVPPGDLDAVPLELWHPDFTQYEMDYDGSNGQELHEHGSSIRQALDLAANSRGASESILNVAPAFTTSVAATNNEFELEFDETFNTDYFEREVLCSIADMNASQVQAQPHTYDDVSDHSSGESNPSRRTRSSSPHTVGTPNSLASPPLAVAKASQGNYQHDQAQQFAQSPQQQYLQQHASQLQYQQRQHQHQHQLQHQRRLHHHQQYQHQYLQHQLKQHTAYEHDHHIPMSDYEPSQLYSHHTLPQESQDIPLGRKRHNGNGLPSPPHSANASNENSGSESNEFDTVFQCQQCPATFRIRGYLTRHMKKHAEIMKFNCPFHKYMPDDKKCHVTGGFSRRDTFKMHLKARHFLYPQGTSRKNRTNCAGSCAGCGQQFLNNEKWIEQHLMADHCPLSSVGRTAEENCEE